MAVQLEDNEFRYNNKTYSFSVTLTNADVKPYTLTNVNIRHFIYTNELNKLYLTGKLVFTDVYGKIDAFIDKLYTLCLVVFLELQQKYDDGFELKFFKAKKIFRHNFLVDNIKILERDAYRVTYELSLVSVNAYKCLAHIEYSNYSLKDNKNILSVMKSCINLAGCKVDEDTFDKIKVNVDIDYITNGNDNLCSTIKFLMNRFYYFNKKDSSLKFIVYDEYTDKYCLFDLSNDKLGKNASTILVSMQKSDKEKLVNQEDANFSMITKCNQQLTARSTFEHRLLSFSFANNKFIDKTISQDSILNYINSRPDGSDMKNKYRWNKENLLLDFYLNGSYWNNDYNIYSDMVDNLMKNNAIVINVGGQILRMPAGFILLAIDRDEQVDTEEPKDYEDMKSRFKGFEGGWIIGKVTSIIEPKESRYTLNLTLFRNFNYKK